jgi:hypothetical protein
MRKNLIAAVPSLQSRELHGQEWLDIEDVARVQLTSEDPSFPIEPALVSGKERDGRRPKRANSSFASFLTSRESSGAFG